MKWLSAVPVTAALLLGAGEVIGGPNPNATLVLHAIRGSGTCTIADPCLPSPGHPSIEITEPGERHQVYVLVRNFTDVAGIEFSLRWPDDWEYLGYRNCQSGCTDCGMFFPPLWSCCFNCVTAATMAVVLRVDIVPASGCMEIVEDDWGGPIVGSCSGKTDIIRPEHRGRVCAGPGGINSCDPLTPVAATTWGRLKGTYQ